MAKLFTPLTPPVITTATNNALALVLAKTTIVYLTSTQPTTAIISLVATTGNVDGLVVCFANINTTGLVFTFPSESMTETDATRRFRSNATMTVSQYGAVWYRWSSVSSRWQVIAAV